MRLTKEDYERQGRDAAQTGVARETAGGGLNPDGWQYRAWCHGYDVEKKREVRSKPKTPLNVIDTDMLAKMLVDKSPQPSASARVMHAYRLAHDYNSERRAPRRLRLFKAVGRMLERIGISQPIPLVD